MVALAVLSSSCVYLQRVSMDAGNAQYNAPTAATDVSADGTYVVFDTTAALSPLDTNNHADIYRKNTRTGAVHLVSRDGVTVGNGTSASAAISADGLFVVFESKSSNLTGGGPADTNGEVDVFLHDVVALTTIRVSLTQAGAEAADESYDPDISGDGDIVAFTSLAPLDPTDTNGVTDIYVYGSGATVESASRFWGGGFPNAASRNAALGSDGEFIAYESDAGGLAPNTGPHTDVYSRMVPDGFILAASAAAGGSDGDSLNPAIDDSSFAPTIAFESDATNLVAGDTNGFRDVFVNVPIQALTERVSVDSNGGQSDDDSGTASITDGGDIVAFETSSWLLHGQGTGRRAVVRDRDEGRTTAASAAEVQARSTTISEDGLYVLFGSQDAVVTPDANGSTPDSFLTWWSEPKAVAVTPAVVPAGATTSVTITGLGFQRLAATDVWTHYGDTQGISYSNIVLVDHETVTADITVGPLVNTGAYNVVVEASGTGPGIFSGTLAICTDCIDVS